MRKLFLILLLLPISIFAQTTYKDFQILDNELVFRKVYETNLSGEELANSLKLALPKINAFKLDVDPNQNASQLSGSIQKMFVNYRKYGGTLMGTATILNSPISGNAIVDIKDNKYRVTIKDITFNDASSIFDNQKHDYQLTPYVLRKKNTEFKKNPDILKVIDYVNSQLSDSFDLAKIEEKSKDDKW